MNFYNKHYITRQAGFTLVEIMVGLVIGLLAALVIMQVYSVFEGQRRATTGTADAQTNGSIALYNIGREVQLAGYSLMPSGLTAAPDSPLDCTTITYGATGITSITPISITNDVAVAGVTAASDRITISYGSSQNGGVPTKITAAPTGNVVPVDTNFGCAVGDIALVSNGATCALSTVTAVSAVASLPVVTLNLQNVASAVSGGDLACLGAWNTVTYSVSTSGNLERNGVPVVSGVVNLQAQYGVSTLANSNQVNEWVNAVAPTWATPSVLNRNRIKAVRIAVVTRNAKIEPAAVTTSCTQAVAPTPTTGLCAWQDVAVAGAITTASPAPAVSFSTADWTRYRYRVFETIIPLRNVVWSKDTL
jgi:type IV pilus assembly protein PilW